MAPPGPAPVVVRLLARGQFRARSRRYLLLAMVFAIGLFGFFGLVSVVEGTREAITAPLAATVSGDLRVTRGTADLGAGKGWDDPNAVVQELRQAGGTVSVRLESTFITVRGESFADNSAGLLVGIDPQDPDEAGRIERYMEWGERLSGREVFAPDTGRAYTPILIGKPTVGRLNLTLPEDGSPVFDDPLTLTSGHLQSGPGSLPITLRVVVVGVFDTGLEPLDKFTAFVPIEAARLLLGHNEKDPVVNTFVITGGDIDRAATLAHRLDPETETRTSEAFAFDYIGGVLVLAYAAGALTLAVFLAVLLVWLVHETGVLVRADGPIVSSLRAIGVPVRTVVAAYTVLLVACVLAGALAAALVTGLLALFAPPIPVMTTEARLTIPWAVRPLAFLLVGVAVALASVASVWATGRRLSRLNILDGMRGA